MKKICKGDEVIVISGKDKGKRGKLVKIISGNKVIVENINKVKKHVKGNYLKNITSGIIEKEMPLNISNIAVFNLEKNKADKVGFKILENGKKVRIFKSNNEIISFN